MNNIKSTISKFLNKSVFFGERIYGSLDLKLKTCLIALNWFLYSIIALCIINGTIEIATNAKVIAYKDKVIEAFGGIFIKDESLATLITGILAIAAAAWSVKTTKEQIKQSEKNHQDIIVRKFKAAKLLLPNNITRIREYLIDCYTKTLKILIDFEKDEPFEAIKLNNFPYIEDDVVKNAIENSNSVEFDKLLSFVLFNLHSIKNMIEVYEDKNAVVNILHLIDIITKCILTIKSLNILDIYSRAKKQIILDEINISDFDLFEYGYGHKFTCDLESQIKRHSNFLIEKFLS